MMRDGKILPTERCKDAGLALVLLFLLAYQAWKSPVLFVLAIIFLLIVMTYPILFQPFARFWFWLSAALGSVVSKIVLTALFFVLVFPVGLVRRISGKDPMRNKSWKNGKGSVFRVREHRFGAKDLEHPY